MRIDEARYHEYDFIRGGEPQRPDFHSEHMFLLKRHEDVVERHRETLRDYTTASRGYADFMLTPRSEYRKRMGSAITQRFIRKKQALERAFKSAPSLGVKIHVYSGLGVDHAKDLMKLQPGKKIKTKTVLSTSINPGIAKRFMKTGQIRKGGKLEQAILHIELPEETKGIYVHSVSPNPSEHEYILPPKSKLQITGIHTVTLDGDKDGARRRTMISAKLLTGK